MSYQEMTVIEIRPCGCGCGATWGCGRSLRAWEACAGQHDQIKSCLDKGLKLTKVGDLLARRGVEVPYQTLHRYPVEQLGCGRQAGTVRVADVEPGEELQIDFGKMGLIVDPESGRRRTVWALILTAVGSRHTFAWLSFRQTVGDLIDGLEAAWEFYDGVFGAVIPDNLKAIVDRSDPAYVRDSFWAGERVSLIRLMPSAEQRRGVGSRRECGSMAPPGPVRRRCSRCWRRRCLGRHRLAATTPQPGRQPRSTAYALRDLDKLIAQAARHGEAIGTYAEALLEVPLPRTRMCTVYRLVGLVKLFRADHVEQACVRALECEGVDVGLITGIVEQAAETDPPTPEPNVIATAGRFARDPSEFAIDRKATP